MYLNGNNEMAPEMYDTLVNLKNMKEQENKNIVVEIGQANEKLVKIIRGKETLIINDKWSGVRRYLIEDSKEALVDDLGKVNMADYKNLYNFMEWGIKSYPAKRYMITIAGHGFTVLTLSDFSGEIPYTMGLYEICLAINNIQKELNVSIDILNLDICNMNNIEVIYELAKVKRKSERYLMTYIKDGPLKGMNYYEFLNELNERTTKEILKSIVSNSEIDLLAVELNNARLKKLKEITSKMGYDYLSTDEKEQVYRKYSISIAKEVEKIVAAYKLNDIEKVLINMIDADKYKIENMEAFLKVYNKLGFTKNNYWANVVARKQLTDTLNSDVSKARQEVLTKDNMNAIIQLFNGNLSKEECMNITNNIYEMNNWKKHLIVGK